MKKHYLYLFLNQITSSLETSIGNLNAKETDEKKENVFYKILYLCFFIYGIIVKGIIYFNGFPPPLPLPRI